MRGLLKGLGVQISKITTSLFSLFGFFRIFLQMFFCFYDSHLSFLTLSLFNNSWEAENHKSSSRRMHRLLHAVSRNSYTSLSLPTSGLLFQTSVVPAFIPSSIYLVYHCHSLLKYSLFVITLQRLFFNACYLIYRPNI